MTVATRTSGTNSRSDSTPTTRRLRGVTSGPSQRATDRLRIRLNRIHGWIYRLTGGRLGARVAGQRVLLLTTTGRCTRRQQTTPVHRYEIGGRTVIVASNGGSATPPAWLANLSANPQVSVVTDAGAFLAVARIAGGSERTRAWRAISHANPGLACEIACTEGREFPVVMLQRAAESRTGGQSR